MGCSSGSSRRDEGDRRITPEDRRSPSCTDRASSREVTSSGANAPAPDPKIVRKDDAKTDPYKIFAQLVRSGSIGKDFDENLAQWNKARGE